MSIVRRATALDVDFLWQMLFEAAHADEQGMTVDDVRRAPDLAHYVQGWGASGDLGVIGEVETDVPAGAAWLRLFTAQDPSYGFIDESTPELAIAVRPDARGIGLGTAMLRRLLRDAAAQYDAVCLSVRTTNPALHLYERMGFEVIAGRDAVNRVGTQSVTMRRAL